MVEVILARLKNLSSCGRRWRQKQVCGPADWGREQHLYLQSEGGMNDGKERQVTKGGHEKLVIDGIRDGEGRATKAGGRWWEVAETAAGKG